MTRARLTSSSACSAHIHKLVLLKVRSSSSGRSGEKTCWLLWRPAQLNSKMDPRMPQWCSPVDSLPKMGRFRDVKLREIPQYVRVNNLHRPQRAALGVARLVRRYKMNFMGDSCSYAGRMGYFTPIGHVLTVFLVTFYMFQYRELKGEHHFRVCFLVVVSVSKMLSLCFSVALYFLPLSQSMACPLSITDKWRHHPSRFCWWRSLSYWRRAVFPLLEVIYILCNYTCWTRSLSSRCCPR